jgi:hypothetical protein
LQETISLFYHKFHKDWRRGNKEEWKIENAKLKMGFAFGEVIFFSKSVLYLEPKDPEEGPKDPK